MTTTAITMVLFRPKIAELRETFTSLEKASGDYARLHLLVSGSFEHHADIRDYLAHNVQIQALDVTYRFDNLGFAGGHNYLFKRAFAAGASRVFCMNPDVTVDPGSLNALARCCPDNLLALVGPTLMRSDSSGSARIVDSLGISWTWDGRHFDIGQGGDRGQDELGTKPVQGITGAALMINRKTYEYIRAAGFDIFDSMFLAYREDAELGVRAAVMGVALKTCDVPGFSHVRSSRGFERENAFVNYLSVRNRFFLRWALGDFRPSKIGGATLRDLAVVAAALTVERGSAPALAEAFRMRRLMKARYRRLKAAVSSK